VAHDHGVDHGEFFVGELVLAQLAQAHVRLEHDLPPDGSRSPPRIFMKVDLPQPLAPIRP
jgi:hypothetical protein